ncbi:MAG: fibronectin type III domain-containing protein [Bacteroidota bacterium]
MKKICFLLVFILIAPGLFAISGSFDPGPAGQWKFDDPSDLLKAEAGRGVPLELKGSHTAVDGPEMGNGAVQIGPGSWYVMKHRTAPNGGGSFVNEYSLLFDFMIPEKDIWHTFFQTNMDNSNDGDFFINPSGNIGVAAVGYGSYETVPGEWYRLVISVKNGSFFKCYLDGELFLSGTVQDIDGRFSLDSLLLVFADEDGEDGRINCAELAFWNRALSADEVENLGGYGHHTGPFLMFRKPYLQSPSMNSMTISWHDTSAVGTKVEYGTGPELGQSTSGTSELVAVPYRWHTVKLTSLAPGTVYYYRVSSGSASSPVYRFKTLPEEENTGIIRFLIFGDVHSSDTTASGKVVRAARDKISELYGQDPEKAINGIFNTGDIVMSGNSVAEYSTKHFSPMAPLTAWLPSMVVAGNHEGESPYFYQYMKLDDLSVFPSTSPLREKVWYLRVENALFIGLNTNITEQYGTTMASWLDGFLNTAEQDATIDFVYLFFHHPPFSELWYPVITFDNGPAYVQNTLFPVIEKYSKVMEIHYGHTHGFERGTIKSGRDDGDFRIICGGGGGGFLDPWVEGLNYNYDDIHISYSHFGYQILEIDPAEHSYRSTSYSLGNKLDFRNNEAVDSWYRKTDQPAPSTPVAESVEVLNDYIQFGSSAYEGMDSLMTVELQIVDSADVEHIRFEKFFHWTDIYGVDDVGMPFDLNAGKDLCALRIRRDELSGNETHLFRVRYRDHNLRWSAWSNTIPFREVRITENPADMTRYYLGPAFPNPSGSEAFFDYHLPERGEVIFKIYNADSRLLEEYNAGILDRGSYSFSLDTAAYPGGVFFCSLNSGGVSITKKLVIMKQP